MLFTQKAIEKQKVKRNLQKLTWQAVNFNNTWRTPGVVCIL
jgi:hypothetical protein